MILPEIVEQLELCNYTCEGGDLKDNVAFIELKRLTVAHDTAMAEVGRLNVEREMFESAFLKVRKALGLGLHSHDDLVEVAKRVTADLAYYTNYARELAENRAKLGEKIARMETERDSATERERVTKLQRDDARKALAVAEDEGRRLRTHATGIGDTVKKAAIKIVDDAARRFKWQQDTTYMQGLYDGIVHAGMLIGHLDVGALLAGDDAETSWPPGFIPCSEPNCERAYAATRKAAERVATEYLGVRCNSCNQATVTKGHLLSEGEWAEKEAACREALKAAPGGQSE